MSVWLLDVNALLALAWEEHEFHGRILARMMRLEGDQWASCAITQLGFMRVSSTPGLFRPAPTPGGARQVLHALLAHTQHRFLTDPPTAPVEMAATMDALQGYRQITDAYLLAIAQHHQARVLSFDRGMHLLAENVVELISP
ncbi:MAG: PIN domain-containing protein [Rhodanobacteraceae bacterium]|nr:PIN domain-containing protein [Rhodanobacteraceae bacterium]